MRTVMKHTISAEWSKRMLAAEENITPGAGPLAMRPFSDPDDAVSLLAEESRPENTDAIDDDSCTSDRESYDTQDFPTL